MITRSERKGLSWLRLLYCFRNRMLCHLTASTHQG